MARTRSHIEILAGSVSNLAHAGANFFACPDNTAHLALERPGPALALPGVHIAEVLADRAAEAGYHRVGVLGTKWTTGSELYPRGLARRDVQAELPAEGDRDVIDTIIFDELVNSVFTSASKDRYVEIIARLGQRGCDETGANLRRIGGVAVYGLSGLRCMVDL